MLVLNSLVVLVMLVLPCLQVKSMVARIAAAADASVIEVRQGWAGGLPRNQASPFGLGFPCASHSEAVAVAKAYAHLPSAEDGAVQDAIPNRRNNRTVCRMAEPTCTRRCS